MKKLKMISAGLLLLLFCLSVTSFAQTQTNKEALEKISYEQAALFKAQKQEAVNYAKSHGIPVSYLNEDGRYLEIQYIDASGSPQYYITSNSNSAATISTNQVYSGGGAGLSLNGSGITARQWDAGAVLTTHQELTGRVVMGDGVTTLHYHSTHVAGTMIASGVVSSSKGMAPAAQLRAFDWNSDASEMAAEAANGSLMSNHSYGYVRGWYSNNGSWVWYGNPSISTQEDYLFGFYDSQAQSWDNVAYNAPYYLICKSAGNDRGDGPVGGAYPQDGPYDCIGHAGIAKNILTVGAVNDIPGGYNGPSSVVQPYFSCWGPADDGRIKPDIMTNGVSLYSTDKDSNTDYVSLSGTSMACPSAAGSLALLQEHWNDLHPNTYMYASTLKALVIHTADECGTATGPDYQFGWGLMNTENAALKLSEDMTLNVVDQLVLNNGGTYTRTVQSNGTVPLRVTVCWTDPAGTPVSAQLDPSNPMLVNDLDLRLTRASNTYYPWKLDRNNPANAATNTAENNTDNVEMVYIAAPAAGDYVITVDHDGTLTGGSQAFAIIISGIVNGVQPPVANFSASKTNPYVGETVIFSDLSTNNPTSWSWSFTPATVTFVNGTSATSQNPQVTFNATGAYTVSLTVTNSAGSNTKTETNYITVSNPPPSCTMPVNPAAGATSVSVNTSLSWNAVDGATGYLIFFGTNNPPTNIENGDDLGNVTSYTPVTALYYSTAYYWKIVPYSASGQATGCPTWSFTTENSPYVQLPYTESFESGFGQWVQATYDNFNWTRRSGYVPTPKTGPSGAYNGTYYIYTESNGQQQGEEACLEATFNFTGIPNPEISLWYHMYGNQMGSLHVDVFNGTWNTDIWVKYGQQQTLSKKPFYNAVIPLTGFGNQSNIIIRIRGKRGSGERSDMAVDYVSVRQQGTSSPGGQFQEEENLKSGDDATLFANTGNEPNINLYCTDGKLFIRNVSDDHLKGQVQIYNITGQMMRSFNISGTGDFQISTGLQPGLYIVRILAGNQIISKKILIE